MNQRLFLLFGLASSTWAINTDVLRFELQSLLQKGEIQYSEYQELYELASQPRQACQLLEYYHPERIDLCIERKDRLNAQIGFREFIEIDSNESYRQTLYSRGEIQKFNWNLEWNLDSNRLEQRSIALISKNLSWWFGENLGENNHGLSLFAPPQIIGKSQIRQFWQGRPKQWNGTALELKHGAWSWYNLGSWNHFYSDKTDFDSRFVTSAIAYQELSLGIQNTQVQQNNTWFGHLYLDQEQQSFLVNTQLDNGSSFAWAQIQRQDSSNRFRIEGAWQSRHYQNPYLQTPSNMAKDTIDSLWIHGKGPLAFVKAFSGHQNPWFDLSQGQSLLLQQEKVLTYRGQARIDMPLSISPTLNANWRNEFDTINLDLGLRTKLQVIDAELSQRIFSQVDDSATAHYPLVLKLSQRTSLNRHELQIRIPAIAWRDRQSQWTLRHMISLPSGPQLNLSLRWNLGGLSQIKDPAALLDLGYLF